METGAGSSPGAKPLGETRQATIDALCEHFANDAIPVEEFERRVEVAHRAASVDELRRLLQDLPEMNLPAVRSGGTVPGPRARRRVVPAAHERDQGFVVAVMGGAIRKGHWSPARTNFAFTLMGGAELDFREAALPRGVTQVQVLAIMGGVDIIVPPGVNVESHGIGIMGGFEDAGEQDHDPSAPTLRIAGLAVMGGVDISVRHPGESARDARRRRKQESRDRRRFGDS
ncbi:MAG TPA: DUF1707 domain-containing protein [Longimicrobiales bacterium]|nr:DUF1707 domain-containing protein [Longimicrobiales bacterium]